MALFLQYIFRGNKVPATFLNTQFIYFYYFYFGSDFVPSFKYIGTPTHVAAVVVGDYALRSVCLKCLPSSQ